MKLIFAIISDEDSNLLADNLSHEGLSTTKLCSTGGFLKTGNTTFLIATDDDKVDKAIDVIRETCKSRRRLISSENIPDSFDSFNMAKPIEVKVGGATVFTLDIDQFFKL